MPHRELSPIRWFKSGSNASIFCNSRVSRFTIKTTVKHRNSWYLHWLNCMALSPSWLILYRKKYIWPIWRNNSVGQFLAKASSAIHHCCCCLHLSVCVFMHPCVHQSLACPCDESTSLQARTEFGPHDRKHLLLGERQEAQILKFNAPPYTLCLSCPSYSKFSQLSYGPGCSRELWCRKCATWLWNKYVLIFSKTLFYTHIQRHTAAGTKCYKTM